METNKLSDQELIKELQSRFDENHKMYNELTVLLSQLKDLNHKLEESEKLKSNFLSNIRNEIINPFASIMGLSDSIMSSEPQDWEQVKRMASMIHTEAFNLDFQLKNIFTAADLEAGDARPEIINVDVWALIEEVAGSFAHELRQKKIQILYVDNEPSANDMFVISTDKDKLRLILRNLIYNAINYSKENASIFIKVGKFKGILSIAVQDFGVGIPEEEQSYIFDRFRQVQQGPTKQYKGHGLGLSVTKGLTDILHGQISFNSLPEKGSTFTVSLPESTPSFYGSRILSEFDEFLFTEDFTGDAL